MGWRGGSRGNEVLKVMGFSLCCPKQCRQEGMRGPEPAWVYNSTPGLSQGISKPSARLPVTESFQQPCRPVTRMSAGAKHQVPPLPPLLVPHAPK